MSDQVALVTGGARGQGAAHAEALAVGRRARNHRRCPRRGRSGDRRGAQPQGAAGALHPPRRHRRAARGREVVSDIEAREGGLDILVNNAGIMRVAPLSDLSIERLGPGPARQRDVGRARDPGGDAGDDAPWRRLDHQRRLHGRPSRRGRLRRVRGVQSGRPRGDAGGGARARSPRHPGQRDQPRRRGNADERRRAAGWNVGGRSPRSARTTRRDLAARRLSRLEARLRTSREPTS